MDVLVLGITMKYGDVGVRFEAHFTHEVGGNLLPLVACEHVARW